MFFLNITFKRHVKFTSLSISLSLTEESSTHSVHVVWKMSQTNGLIGVYTEFEEEAIG